MKKITLASFLGGISLFLSCSPDQVEEIKVSENDEYVKLSLDLGGELAISPNSFGSTQAESNDLFGIQFYDENQNPYAFVIGDDISKISLNLPPNRSFDIKATFLRDAKENLSFWDEDQVWGPPLWTENRSGTVLNKTYYTSGNELSWISHVDVDTKDHYGNYDEVERFYGVVKGYQPTQESKTISMNLKRVVFGLKLNLVLKEPEGIDSLQLSINQNGARIFTIPVSEGRGTLKIPYLTLAVPKCEGCTVALDLIGDDYKEDIPISIGTSDNHTRFFDGSITVKRNKIMVINALLEDDEKVSGGF